MEPGGTRSRRHREKPKIGGKRKSPRPARGDSCSSELGSGHQDRKPLSPKSREQEGFQVSSARVALCRGCLPLLRPRPQRPPLQRERQRFNARGHPGHLHPSSPGARPAFGAALPPRFGDWRDPFLPQSSSPFRLWPMKLHPPQARIGEPCALVPGDWFSGMKVTGEIPPPAGAGSGGTAQQGWRWRGWSRRSIDSSVCGPWTPAAAHIRCASSSA